MIVLTFGAKAPTLNLPLVEEQIRLAHKFQNRLAEIEQQKRRCLTFCEIRHVPRELILREAALDAALGTKSAGAAAKAEIRKVRAAIKTARAEIRARPAVAALLTKISEVALRVHKLASEKSGVYWGTKGKIFEAINQAGTKPKRVPGKKPRPWIWEDHPKFQRWDGSGMAAVQLQRGLSAEKVLACKDTRLRIRVLPIPEGATSRRAVEHRKAVVSIRIGSVGIKPVWAEVPIVMHRARARAPALAAHGAQL